MDLIIAVSVFTHLPLDACKSWINKLSDLLNPEGRLILTFNDISNCPFNHNGSFHFEEQSEDSSMSGIADRLDNVSEYGSTFFSEEYLMSMLLNVDANKEIRPNFIGNHSALIIKK
jgi:hypothetical protein